MRLSAHLAHLYVSAALLVGCSGQLVIEDQDTAGGGSCQSSAECGPGRVCQGLECVESAGRCSSAIPDGDCPLGRLCQGGICVLATDSSSGGDGNGNGNASTDVFDCSECEAGDFCDGFRCVDPTDSAAICGEFVLDGACPLGEVCVGGACTPIKAGKNDCAPERPAGLCPAPGYCVEGFCLPVDERPCSGVALDGACPAGQSCEAGSCSVVACASTAPFGACSSGLVCLDGTCRPKTALLSCDDLDCAGRNREACSVDAAGIARCGACLDGFSDDDAGTCVPESCLSLGCAGQLRVCDASVVPAVCGDCLDGYKEGGFGCEPVECADLSCDNENRACVPGSTVAEPAACGDCLEGFVAEGGVCRLATCDDIQSECAARSRVCDAGTATTGATCGDCLPGASEGANGQCTTCSVPGGCRACTGTADCGAGTYCDPVSGFCAQDCAPNAAGDSDDQQCVAEGFGAGSVCSPNGRCARSGVGGGVCGAGVLEGEIIEPIVAILVDQSGSMRDAFEDGWRWFEVERALFGDTNGTCLDIDNDGNCCAEGANENGCSNAIDYSGTYTSRDPASDPGQVGLLTRFQDEIQFAIVFYETQNDEFDVGPFQDARSDLQLRFPLASNPALATDDPTEALEPAFGVRDDLALFFARHMWEGQTPTSNALFAVDEYLRLIRQARADAGEPIPPTYILLATDGAPDYANYPDLVSCANPDPTTVSEYRVLEAVNFARREQVITLRDGVTTVNAGGTQTFALSVGGGIALNHLQDVANAGAGVPTMVTNIMPELDDIGVLPLDYGSLDTRNPRDIPNSSNPYFNAYSAPSPVYGLTAQTCTQDSDCGSGRRCAGGYCCQENCEESLCADSFFDTGFNDSGESRLPPDVGCNAPGLDRMTGCIARNFGRDYDELFADLSSRESCDGANPCTRGNEVCVDGECVVASCTPSGTTDAVGNVVMAPCFVGDNAASLGDALEGVFNSVLSCTVELAISDPITKNGVVWLDDDPVPDDQWRVTGVNRVEVVGDACATLKDGNPHFLSVEINTCAGGG